MRETRSPGKALAEWGRQLVADQDLEKTRALIHVRKYELLALIEERELASGSPDAEPELSLRLERARKLSREPEPADRAAANDLQDKLDGILPLIADDGRLGLMLELELARADSPLIPAQRERGHALLKREPGQPFQAWQRREVELLVTSASGERGDASREERIAGELRQNYLTWLGLALFLLLAGVFATAVVTSRYGLWAEILLALLSVHLEAP